MMIMTSNNSSVNELNSVQSYSSIETGEMKPLSSSFQPGPYDVICARGKRAFNHPGNVRFRALIEANNQQYSAATSKLDKSLIVSAILGAVRNFTPDGGFVKERDGAWYEVGDHIAREKIGQSFRDLLHTKYRSSTKAKKRRRDTQKQQPLVARSAGGVPKMDRDGFVGTFSGDIRKQEESKPSPMPALETSKPPAVDTSKPPAIETLGPQEDQQMNLFDLAEKHQVDLLVSPTLFRQTSSECAVCCESQSCTIDEDEIFFEGIDFALEHITFDNTFAPAVAAAAPPANDLDTEFRRSISDTFDRSMFDP